MKLQKLKKKKGWLEGYKTYNPEIEGFGSEDQWSQTFKQRVGLDQARIILNKTEPLTVLKVRTWTVEGFNEVRSLYRKLVLENYPDIRDGKEIGNKQKFLEVQSAYELIEDQFKRKGII